MTALERLRKVANEVNEDRNGPIFMKIDQDMKIAADCGKYFHRTSGIYSADQAELIVDYYKRQGFTAYWNYTSGTPNSCYVLIKW